MQDDSLEISAQAFRSEWSFASVDLIRRLALTQNEDRASRAITLLIELDLQMRWARAESASGVSSKADNEAFPRLPTASDYLAIVQSLAKEDLDRLQAIERTCRSRAQALTDVALSCTQDKEAAAPTMKELDSSHAHSEVDCEERTLRIEVDPTQVEESKHQNRRDVLKRVLIDRIGDRFRIDHCLGEGQGRRKL